VGVGEGDRAAVGSFFVGYETIHEHIRGLTGKILAPLLVAGLFVGDRV
jgi:hypothetical protein